MPRKKSILARGGTFSRVLQDFEESPAFTTNAESTQANYRYMLRWIDGVLGKYRTDDPVNGIRPKLVQLALDQLADRPAQQSNVRALLVTIDKWASPYEYLCRSITFGVHTVGTDGGHLPWTQAQVTLGHAEARAKLPRAIKLMAHLGQRGSDTIRMRLNDIAHEENPLTGQRVPGVNVIQQKTGLRLWVPFDEEIADLIETWRSDVRNQGAPWLLLTRPDGSPYMRRQLTDHWADERDQNHALGSLRDLGYKTKKDSSVVMHGLRGTRVISLRKAGASVPMISSMIGMSPPMVTRYSRFADQVDMALAAVHKLNTGTRPGIASRENTEKLA